MTPTLRPSIFSADFPPLRLRWMLQGSDQMPVPEASDVPRSWRPDGIWWGWAPVTNGWGGLCSLCSARQWLREPLRNMKQLGGNQWKWSPWYGWKWMEMDMIIVLHLILMGQFFFWKSSLMRSWQNFLLHASALRRRRWFPREGMRRHTKTAIPHARINMIESKSQLKWEALRQWNLIERFAC